MSHNTTNTTARYRATASSSGSQANGDGQISAPPGHNNPYCRARDLPRLIALWPEDILSTDAAVRIRVLGKLRRALRAERRRGLAGHWSYDLARHSQLLAAYRHEIADLGRRNLGERRHRAR